jgi:hypothetical protein
MRSPSEAVCGSAPHLAESLAQLNYDKPHRERSARRDRKTLVATLPLKAPLQVDVDFGQPNAPLPPRQWKRLCYIFPLLLHPLLLQETCQRVVTRA